MAMKFLILFLLGVLTSPTSYALLEEDEQEGRELRWWLIPINIFGTACLAWAFFTLFQLGR
nr:MAG TPA: hypothetical protein [Caudoviricetes sp.]